MPARYSGHAKWGFHDDSNCAASIGLVRAMRPFNDRAETAHPRPPVIQIERPDGAAALPLLRLSKSEYQSSRDLGAQLTRRRDAFWNLDRPRRSGSSAARRIRLDFRVYACG